MTINGVEIKKYRARVKARQTAPTTASNEQISDDGYKIVEGYVSIAAVVLPYEQNAKSQFIPVLVAEEIDFGRLATSGFGQSVFAPMTYNEFEILGEVE